MTRASLALALAFSVAARGADDRESAREHFRKGQTHYALGEFEDAANEFKEAYRLRSEPAILFNIAQAMRLLGSLKQALFYYQQYLAKKPDAPNRTEVEGLMSGVRGKLSEQEQEEANRRALEGKPPEAPEPPADQAAPAAAEAKVGIESPPRAAVPPQAVAAPPPGPARRGPPRFVGWAALGAGAAAEGLALIFRSSAQSAADEVAKKYAAGTLQPSDAKLRSDADSKGRAATIAALGGAALIVAGAVLTFAF